MLLAPCLMRQAASRRPVCSVAVNSYFQRRNTFIRCYRAPGISAQIAAGLKASRPATRLDFEVAIICALPLEADAVSAIFDSHWDDDVQPLDKAPGDPNAYSTGAIGRHNVVLAHMPGMGKASASSAASFCRASFPNLKLALVVGICGVVPIGPAGEEIMPGDVVISDGVVQYDFGRQIQDRFVRKDTLMDSLGRPTTEIRGIMAKLKGLRGRKWLGEKMAVYLDQLQREPELRAEPPYGGGKTLKTQPGRRRSRSTSRRKPNVHFGLIASGDSVIKSAQERDAIAALEGVIAFEMEGAGVWDNLPCVIIKGACDYADSYKTKDWQPYAAATAAACMKAFLGQWVPSRVSNETKGDVYGQKATYQPLHFIPYPENKHFVERTGVIDATKDMLFTEAGHQRVAIVGLGGIGKTQIALHLAHWAKKAMPESSVFWTAALSTGSFEDACKNILNALTIKPLESQDPSTTLRDHLSSDESGSWLLIIDNADDVNMLDRILDRLPHQDNGSILITTRSQDVAVSTAGTAVLRLLEMNSEEATKFLETSLIDKEQMKNEEIVSELLEKLTNFPLAIAQAAAYMNINQLPITEYLRLFRTTDHDMIELLSARFRSTTHYLSSQEAVATTWIISFNQIRDMNSTAASLLLCLGCMEPKAIPQSIFPRIDTDLGMTRAVGLLCGYGFLTRRREEEDMFDMHSLVHMATRIWGESQEDIGGIRQDVLSRLSELIAPNGVQYSDPWRPYLPHARRFLRSRSIIDKSYYNVAMHTGIALGVDGYIQESISLFEEVVAIHEQEPERDEEFHLELLHKLAVSYIHGELYTDITVKLLEETVARRKAIMTDHDPRLLRTQSRLATVYEMTGQMDKAMGLQEHVYTTARRALPRDDYTNLFLQGRFGITCDRAGQVQRAIEVIEEAWASQPTTLDEPRAGLAGILAQLYYKNGNISKAIELSQLEPDERMHSMTERETYFNAEVVYGENQATAAAEAPAFADEYLVNSAFAFYRALKVYPEPRSLLQIYESTVPENILCITKELIANDPSDFIRDSLSPGRKSIEDTGQEEVKSNVSG